MSTKSFGGSRIFVLLGLIFIALIGLRTISTPEIWTHLAQGQNNAPLSFLASDSPVNTTWLYDKLAYTCWTIGGAPLLIILNIIGLLAAFILLLQVSKKWGGDLSQGFALLLGGHLIFQTLDVGPQVVMMLFIALFLFVLSTKMKPVLLFSILIPLQLLWTNMHSSFLYGPLLGVLATIEVMQRRKNGGKLAKSEVPQTMAILSGALFLTTLANPYFLKLHAQVFSNIASPAPLYWSSLFVEYFQIPALKPLILFVLILGAGGLITLQKKLPIMLTACAVYGAFLVWTSPHLSLLFIALAFPFIVLSLTSISEYIHHSLKSLLDKNGNVVVPVTALVLVVLIVASAISIITNGAYVKTGSASNFGLGVQEELYPSDCGIILNDPAFPEKAINLPADGGYLAFNYGRKIFVDYRSGRYDKEILIQLEKMMLGSTEAYNALHEAYRPEAMIINTLSPSAAQGLVTLLSRPIWKLAYFDGTTAILLQNKDEFKTLLSNQAIQKSGLEKLERARAAYAENAGACRAGNPAELIGSGKIFLAFNRPHEAKAIFSLLLQGNGKIPGAWIGLGISQLELKEFDAAVQSLKTAINQSPNSLEAWASYATACKYAGRSEEHALAIEKVKKLAELNRNNAKTEKSAVQTEKRKTQAVPLDELTVPD